MVVTRKWTNVPESFHYVLTFRTCLPPDLLTSSSYKKTKEIPSQRNDFTGHKLRSPNWTYSFKLLATKHIINPYPEMRLFAWNGSCWQRNCWSAMTCRDSERSIHPGDELATVAYSLLFRAPWMWQLITWQVKRDPQGSVSISACIIKIITMRRELWWVSVWS